MLTAFLAIAAVQVALIALGVSLVVLVDHLAPH